MKFSTELSKGHIFENILTGFSIFCLQRNTIAVLNPVEYTNILGLQVKREFSNGGAVFFPRQDSVTPTFESLHLRS